MSVKCMFTDIRHFPYTCHIIAEFVNGNRENGHQTTKDHTRQVVPNTTNSQRNMCLVALRHRGKQHML